MKFEQVPGQNELISHLLARGKTGQVAHALLFSGKEGGAALMLALAYAQYLNCEQPTETDSCGTCPACVKTSRFIHPDLHFCFPWAKSKSLAEKGDDLPAFLPLFRRFLTEMPYGRLTEWAAMAEFENRTPIINVKTVRDMMINLQLKAYEGKYKIQIIWLPETMRTEGANAFLKWLEEPPPFTLFFLISHQAELLLPTVISRTQRVNVAPLSEETLAQFLAKSFDLDENKTRAIATLAEGDMAEAHLLINEPDGDFHKIFLDWQRSCYSNDVHKLIGFTEAFVDLGKELQKGFLKFSLGRIRQAMALHLGAAATVHLPPNEVADLQRLGKILHLDLLEFQLQELEKAFMHIDRNASGRMVFFDLSLRIADAFAHTKAMVNA